MQNNVNDPYLLNSQKMFTPNMIRIIIFIFAILITELTKVWRGVFQVLNIVRYWLRRYIPVTKRFIEESPSKWITKQADEMIEKRKNIGHTGRTDLLQLMLESMSDQDFIQVRF